MITNSRININFNLKLLIVKALFFFIVCSCQETNSKQKIVENSPYEIFFNQLKIDKLTDTILVQNRTKVFGCGTAFVMHNDELTKSGLNKYYEKYGTVLSNLSNIDSFAKRNNVKILWITRGNEGELFQLSDSILHNNSKLEKRLIAEKTFLTFDDNPKSLDSVTIDVMINHRKQNKVIFKTFELSKNKNIWKIDKQNDEEMKKE